jgi:hypothetical protein
MEAAVFDRLNEKLEATTLIADQGQHALPGTNSVAIDYFSCAAMGSPVWLPD